MEVSRYLSLLIALLICSLQDSLGIDAPDNVLVANEGSTDTLNVTWVPPVNATAHQVTWSLPDGTDNDTSIDLGGEAAAYSITGLTPGTLYNVTVTAKNGTSDNMDGYGQGRTLPSPVSDLDESGATNESISAQWTKPNGTVHQYLVSCSEGTVDPPSPVTEDGSAMYQASCIGLPTAGADYTINVTSQSGDETGTVSSLTITALPNAVQIVAGDSTNSSYKASWVHPEGEIDSFQVFCYENDPAPEDITTNVTSNTMYEVTCENLPTAGSGYKFSVVSVSRDKNATSETVLYTNPNVVYLRAGPITTTQITVVWDDPAGEEDSFIVDCGDDGSPDITLLPGDATDDTFQATCNVTMAGADYNINVTSVSGAKQSSVTSTFTAATPEQVTILNPTSNTTSITVTWDAISADEFEVVCSEGDSSPLSPLDGSATQVSCQEVTPGGNHSVSIVTLENNGRSVETVAYVVADPNVVSLRADLITTRQITVMWDDPAGEEDSFIVDCGNDGNADFTLISGSPFQATCNVTMAGADYNITVTSVSGDKQSSVTSTFTAATPEQVTITSTTSDTTSITVTWDEIPSADRFEVNCSDGNPSPSSPLDGTATQVSCQEVTPGGNHSVRVVTLENNGMSAETVAYVVALPLSANLTAGGSMTTSVSAMWPYPGGMVDVFEIDCSNGTERNATVVVDQTDLDTSYLVRCDEVWNPGDNYTMVVTSVSNMQENSARIVLTALPLSVVLVASNSTISSVSATWLFPGGVVDEFEVECSNGTESNATAVVDQFVDTSYLVRCDEVWNPGDNYTMVVTSVSNMQKNSASIVLTALPLSVNLVASNSTTSSVSATWQFPGGVVEEFEVECSNGTESNATVVVDQTDLDTSYLVRCDEVWNPGDNYTMVVTSVSNMQENSASIVLTALPLSVELVASNSTTSSVSTTWQFPGGVVEAFEVECSSGNKTTYMYTVQDMEYMYVSSCEDLETPGDNYTMTVTSLSNMQRNSASIILTALPEAVTLKEEIARVTTTSITASWSNATGVFDYYEVVCSIGTVSSAQVNPSDELIASCTGLPTPGDNHIMSVTTVSNGQRSATDTITITALPSAVTLLEGPSTNTTISATWTIPGSKVNTFVITCSAGTASPPSIAVDSSPTNEMFTAHCTGLPTPGLEYFLSVVAISNGKQSDNITVGVHASPASVALVPRSSTTTTVSANWMQPESAVEHYVIECSSGYASPATINNTDELSYTASCVNLKTPGETYTMTVFSIVDNGMTNTSSSIDLVALPEYVTLMEERDMVTTTTITASWSNVTGVVEYYEVACSDGTVSSAQVDPLDELIASCTGLTPGGDYDISVTTISGIQRSATTTITITAYPDTVVLSAGTITTRQITVMWDDPNGEEDSFLVDCDADGITDIMLLPDDATDTTFQATCNVTTAGADYNITVTSVSGDKESPVTSTFTAATPMQVTIADSSSDTTSITVIWNELSSADGFRVDCSEGTPSLNPPLPGSATQVTCDNVTSGGNHSVSIVTLENNGESPETVTYVVAVPLSAVLAAADSTTTSVSAMWPYPGGLVDIFKVDCSNGTESDATVVVDQTDLDTSYLVRCDEVLNPGDNYTIVVTSVSNMKENSASIVLTALPLSVNLVASNSTTSSVSATWQFPGGVVEEFEVECSSGNESTDSNQDYSASCEDLDNPGDNYTLTVTSLSNTQRNSASIVLTALPEAVELTEASADVTTSSITATWAVPNGIVEYYDVSCPAGDPSPARVDPSDTLIASCVNLLTPGGDDDISVTAVSGGQRSATGTITITALPEAVVLNGGASNTTVISATWTIPSSVVDAFDITCSDGIASPSSIPVDSSQAGQQLTAYCVELPRSGEQYELSVVAISNNKLSAIANIGVFALPLGVDLVEGPSTTNSASATWMRQNDTVESYNIVCSEGYASPSTIGDTTQESYSASCVNLTGPGATYGMTVFSEVGTTTTSNSTRASSYIQLVAVPESVQNISGAEHTTTTVNVKWQLKQCQGCVYDYFTLTFEPDRQDPITVNYTSGNGQYSSLVSDLTQGRNYSFTVVSVSGVGVDGATLKTSEAQSVEQRTEPASATALVIVPNKTTLSLTWTKAVGDADDYTISVTPIHGTAEFNGQLDNPAGQVTGLTPGTQYQVAVVTVSGDETSAPLTGENRTRPDTPSPVRNPMAEVIDKNTITLTYESPDEPNGDITSYMISYVGSRDNIADHEFSSVYDAILTVSFYDLYPGFSYTFMIRAVNDGGFESGPASSDPVVTLQEAPAPVPDNYAYEENTVVPAKTTTRFTVELPENLFSQENGQLLTFSVIITTDPNEASVGSTNLTYDQAREQSGVMPAYITKADIPYPFAPSFGSSRKRRATEPLATVVVGDGTCIGSPIEYCNGRLSDDTVYYYAFRAYNSEGGVTSSTFGPVKTVKDNTAGIAAGVSVSLLVVIIAVVVGVVFLKRRDKSTSPRPSLEGSDNSGYVGPGHEMHGMRRKAGSSMHRKNHSKPVLLNDFEDHYKRMKADSDFRFTEEYDEIRQVGKEQPIVAATEMVNRAKNRFTNILPYEHSRVKLAAYADEPDTDYINANYMPGFTSPREFIACQGPLPGTLDDMWRMVWEKNTSIIVMLTQLVEKGKIKCHQYWPEDYDSVTYGSIEVSLQAVQQYDHWVIREFTLVKADEKRKMTQYHYTSWPDHGVPEQTCILLDFVRTVRESIQKHANDHPVIAHCSAGVGRTGTYIALDRLMQIMQENDFIDIFGIICEMRMQRNHMVQTEKQYIFIHECVMDLMQREDDTGESIYVNLRSNGYNPEDVNENLLDQTV